MGSCCGKDAHDIDPDKDKLTYNPLDPYGPLPDDLQLKRNNGNRDRSVSMVLKGGIGKRKSKNKKRVGASESGPDQFFRL